MKNWPSAQQSLLRRYWRRCAPSIIAGFTHVPVLGNRYISLHESIKHAHASKIFDSKKPSGIELTLNQIAFIDFFPTEDFEKMKNGLLKIQRNKRSMHIHRESEKDLQHLEEYEIDTTGCVIFDQLSFSDQVHEYQWIENMAIHLYQVSPSFTVLVLFVTPSETYIQKFENILSTDYKEQVQMPFSVLWTKGWHMRRVPSSLSRKIDLQKLVLDLNAEVTALLRENIGAGWSETGPLPTIEMYSLGKGSLNAENHEERSFWNGLGIETHDLFRYQKNGVYLFDLEREEEATLFRSYKVLFDKQICLEGVSLEAYGNSPESAIRHHFIYDCLGGYCVVVALREYAERLVKRVVQLRKQLVRNLSGRNSFLLARWFHYWLSMPKYMTQLNSLKFEVRRFGIEIDFSKLRICSIHDLKGFQRQQNVKGDKAEFLDDIKYRLGRVWKHAKAQLDSLRDNYRDQIEFKTQRAVLVLAILTVVLAVLTAVLAALAVPSTAWNWIEAHLPFWK